MHATSLRRRGYQCTMRNPMFCVRLTPSALLFQTPMSKIFKHHAMLFSKIV